MTYLYLDIETIGAQTPEAKARIAATIKAPGNLKKAESIANWEKESKADAIDEAVARSALNAAYGHVCCIGWAIDDLDAKSILWSPVADDGFFGSEYDMLSNFVIALGEMVGPYRAPVIIGHNVAAFDLRFLWQRAMVLGIRMPSCFPRDPKPWSNEVFDTMAAWAGARDTISMDNLCAALGLPGKGEIDGSMVGDLWANGEYARIAAYCRSDVERTRAIHRKMRVAFGEAA